MITFIIYEKMLGINFSLVKSTYIDLFSFSLILHFFIQDSIRDSAMCMLYIETDRCTDGRQILDFTEEYLHN